jgi:outer membrane receptor protein involved in Fe transport
MRNIFQDEAAVRGSLDFEATFTHFAYADGLLGLANQVQLTNSDVVDQRLWLAAGFLQDDWRILPQLTLNCGLRYEFSPPPTERRNRTANFDPDGSGSLVFAHGGSLASRALVKPNTTNFGPRIGAAYSLGGRTVLRGGYGVYYTAFERFGSEMSWH